MIGFPLRRTDDHDRDPTRIHQRTQIQTQASAWFGIGAPKGTPADIVEKLNRTVNAALADAKKANVAIKG